MKTRVRFPSLVFICLFFKISFAVEQDILKKKNEEENWRAYWKKEIFFILEFDALKYLNPSKFVEENAYEYLKKYQWAALSSAEFFENNAKSFQESFQSLEKVSSKPVKCLQIIYELESIQNLQQKPFSLQLAGLKNFLEGYQELLKSLQLQLEGKLEELLEHYLLHQVNQYALCALFPEQSEKILSQYKNDADFKENNETLFLLSNTSRRLQFIQLQQKYFPTLVQNHLQQFHLYPLSESIYQKITRRMHDKIEHELRDEKKLFLKCLKSEILLVSFYEVIKKVFPSDTDFFKKSWLDFVLPKERDLKYYNFSIDQLTHYWDQQKSLLRWEKFFLWQKMLRILPIEKLLIAQDGCDSEDYESLKSEILSEVLQEGYFKNVNVFLDSKVLSAPFSAVFDQKNCIHLLVAYSHFFALKTLLLENSFQKPFSSCLAFLPIPHISQLLENFEHYALQAYEYQVNQNSVDLLNFAKDQKHICLKDWMDAREDFVKNYQKELKQYYSQLSFFSSRVILKNCKLLQRILKEFRRWLKIEVDCLQKIEIYDLLQEKLKECSNLCSASVSEEQISFIKNQLDYLDVKFFFFSNIALHLIDFRKTSVKNLLEKIEFYKIFLEKKLETCQSDFEKKHSEFKDYLSTCSDLMIFKILDQNLF